MNKSSTNISRGANALKRRDLILNTAVECFLTKGFHKTSIRDIASKAGISLGNLYNHFESKDALIAEISALEAKDLTEFEDILTNTQDPLMAIEQFINKYLEYIEQPSNAVLTVEITAEAIRNPRISEGFLENRLNIAKKILSVLSRGVRLGHFDPKTDNMEVAELLIDLVEGLALRSAFAEKKTSKKSKQSLQYMVQKCICV
jgi:AcrR family transcriptional regulator